MECLIDYIVLAGCGATAPPSGLYINNLAGINYKSIDGLADSDQKTAKGVYDDIQTRAAIRFNSAITSKLGKRYTIYNLKQSYNLNRRLTDTAASAPGTKLVGFTVSTRKDESYPIESYLSNIAIQNIQYCANATDAGTASTVYVIDTTLGVVLWSKAVTLSARWNTIECNQVFSSDYSDNPFSLFVCIDATGLTCYEKEVNQDSFGDLSLRFKGGYTTLTASDDIYFDDITEGDNSYGMSAIVNVTCRWDALVCHNKDLFKNAWLYCLGVEACVEQTNSQRTNRFTLIDIPKAKELLDPENPNSYLTLFDKEIEQVCGSIYVDTSDACIDCGQTYQIKESHP